MEMKSPKESNPTALKRRNSRVISQQQLSSALFELQIDPAGLHFTAGDEILLHGGLPELDRIYSIASGEEANLLRILYRVIPTGARTPSLTQLQVGAAIDFTGPTGSFHLVDPTSPCMFIATGTGIAPAISFLETHPALPITIIHGVRHEEDLVYGDWLGELAYIPCISQGHGHRHFHGKVTSYLNQNPVDGTPDIYLCGSNTMIEDVRVQLVKQGHPGNKILSEPYYFW